MSRNTIRGRGKKIKKLQSQSLRKNQRDVMKHHERKRKKSCFNNSENGAFSEEIYRSGISFKCKST